MKRAEPEPLMCPGCNAPMGFATIDDHAMMAKGVRDSAELHAEDCSFIGHALKTATRMLGEDGPIPPRSSVLREAEGLITGDRNKTYGSPTENFSNIAALWNVQVGHKLSAPLTATDVGVLLAQVKMARMIAQPKRDNYVDAAGYIACAHECQEAEEKL